MSASITGGNKLGSGFLPDPPDGAEGLSPFGVIFIIGIGVSVINGIEWLKEPFEGDLFNDVSGNPGGDFNMYRESSCGCMSLATGPCPDELRDRNDTESD